MTLRGICQNTVRGNREDRQRIKRERHDGRKRPLGAFAGAAEILIVSHS
jgi:signal transduction histidine kinase